MSQKGFNDYLRSKKDSPRPIITISAHGHNNDHNLEKSEAIFDDEVKKLEIFPSSNHSKLWMNEALNELTKASPAKQVAIGGVSGWCSGYLIGKVGKVALIAVGGSIIILQLAHNQGLIQINWNAIESKVSATQKEVKKTISRNLPGILETVKDYSCRYIYLSGSFCAGLLLGICS